MEGRQAKRSWGFCCTKSTYENPKPKKIKQSNELLNFMAGGEVDREPLNETPEFGQEQVKIDNSKLMKHLIKKYNIDMSSATTEVLMDEIQVLSEIKNIHREHLDWFIEVLSGYTFNEKY